MKKKIIMPIFILMLIVISIIFIYKNINIENEKDKEYQDYTPQEEISEEQIRQTKVILYFENIDTGELETEIKLIDANKLINNPEKEIMNLLIKGPQSSKLKKLIPEGTIIYDIKIINSCAEINLSNEFLEFGDEKNKSKIINSIVNSLTNLKEINSVRFLINGEVNDKISEIYVKNNLFNSQKNQ